MAPSQIFILWSPTSGIDSVHSTIESASSTLLSSPPATNLSLCNKDLIGGTVTITTASAPTTKTQAKPKAKPKPVAKKEEEPESKLEVVKPDPDADEEGEEETLNIRTIAAAKPSVVKKTKTPAEQRAVNASKPAKPSDADLPANVKALLQQGGKTFEGQTVVVTGVPPTLGRKNTERLVEAFGAHLGKSLSKKTGWVVVGNDAGPKKLLQIEELGIRTLDEGALIELLEGEGGGGAGGSGGGSKRESSGDEDEDEDDEEEEKPKAKRVKK